MTTTKVGQVPTARRLVRRRFDSLSLSGKRKEGVTVKVEELEKGMGGIRRRSTL